MSTSPAAPEEWTGPVAHLSEEMANTQATGLHAAFMELARAQEAAGIRVGVNENWPDAVLHAHSAGPLVAWRLLRQRGPRVVTAHTTGGTLIGSIRGGERIRRPFEWYLRHLYKRADLVLAPSEDAAAELRGIGIPTPIEVVPNGVDPAGFRRTEGSREAAREALGLPADGVVVVSVGHQQPRKGLDVVLGCARAVPDVRFVWVGGEPDVFSAARVQTQAAVRAAPPNVTFTGVVDRERVRAYLQAADVFLLPTRQETFGLAPLEAGFARLPLVLSALDVFREVFGGPGSTYLVASDVDEAVAAVRRLAASPELREELAGRAEAAVARYASPAVARQTLRAYARAARRRGVPLPGAPAGVPAPSEAARPAAGEPVDPAA